MPKFSRTVSDERVQEILRSARKIMNSGGKHWIKGMLKRWNSQGELCYCSIGGINAATSNKAERNAAKRALAVLGLGVHKETLKTVWDAEYQIINFNDDTTTTWQDVSSVFTKAAKNVAR